jgi:hypothetical protein
LTKEWYGSIFYAGGKNINTDWEGRRKKFTGSELRNYEIYRGAQCS